MKILKGFFKNEMGKSKKQLWQSIFIIALVVLLLATGIVLPLLISKKEKPEPINVKRSYILADPNKPEPKTLNELLHCEKPNIDTILKTPSIIEELKAVESLTDIVDSRMAISNLREIDKQLSDRLDLLSNADDDILYFLGEEGSSNDTAKMHDLINRQKDIVSDLKAVTGNLLAPKESDTLYSLPLDVNMKGIWEEDGEVYIHMIPSGDWVPEEGYKLYRTVNGSKTLLAENIASYTAIYNSTLKVMDEDIAIQLNSDAILTAEKLSTLGIDAEAFRNLAYRTDSLIPKSRVSGKLDFEEMYKALITIPGTIEQKIPESDIVTNNPIYIQTKVNSVNHTVQETSVMKRFSLVPSVVPKGIDELIIMPNGQIKFELAQSILYARQQILTLSFTNDEFAKMSGFLYKDDVSDLNLPVGTEIVYTVESGSLKSFLTVECGKELNLSKPQELVGYGMDERVYLRWNQTENEDEKAIISGYYIERKLKGEDGFKVINSEPVVITYVLDETDIYFETPIFYEDYLSNGITAEYRVYSIDIFGRKSEYSDILEITVEKVSPPNMPVIETPALSEDAGNASPAVLDVIQLNADKKGIALPIFSTSVDTTRFVIYRAEAVGSGRFGTPEMIANIEYDNPYHDMPFNADNKSSPNINLASRPDVNNIKFNGAKHIVLAESNTTYPDLVYYDTDIKEGRTYKYWVAALDLWNNESAWSQSVTVGVPLADMPQLMDDVIISMEIRNLPDYTAEPPGLLYDGLVNYSQASSLLYPSRQVPEGAGTQLIKKAESEGSFIGRFIANEKISRFLDITYNNLPDERYFHMLVGVPKEDFLPDGSARVKWAAYSGEGLEGYVVYRALFNPSSLEEMQKLSKHEIMQLGRWERINDKPITQNQIVVGNLSGNTSELALFLVCLVPEERSIYDISVIPTLPKIVNSFIDAPEGGFVYISWQAPDDMQVDYYRVYRSEVSSFKTDVDESKLEWTLVGDRITKNIYSERVDQSFAHYYYYKITTVSHWGVENTNGVIRKFRVPSTKPPQTPNLLMPLSRKDGIQINFSAVSHCSRYEIYRTEIPVIDDMFIKDVLNMDSDMIYALFGTKTVIDLPGLSSLKAESDQPSTNTLISQISKFKTLSLSDYNLVVSRLSAVGDQKCVNAYQSILEKAGPLALADYSDLSIGMLKKIKWTKVGEVPVDEDTMELIDPATGLLKPLSFIDTTAEYGVVYLYTVQAWNDDNLGSTRPEPVEGATRRNRAFDPIDGLKGEMKNLVPTLSWNTPKMANLSPEKCLQDTVGYIVYRSDTADGEYYQVSPLLFETKWEDTDANPYASNWYRVKVLDTGGYLSEFSDPVLVKQTFSTNIVPIIPPLEEIPKPPVIVVAPKITFSESQYTVTEGVALSISYNLTGTEPITVTAEGKNSAGLDIEGFTVDLVNRKINVSASLAPGTYTVTATALNSAGQSTATFRLTVNRRIVIVKAPKLAQREDEYNFKMTRIASLSVQLSASGTQPFTWTLEPESERKGIPSQVSITSNGVLTVDKSIAVGTYTFYVKVSNSMGYDRKLITLIVQNILRPTSKTVYDIPDITKEYTSDLMMCMNFRLTEVMLEAFDDFARHGYYGTAMLDIGCGEFIPVEIKNAMFTKDSTSHSDTDIMTWGNVYLKTPYKIDSLGIELISLSISPNKNKANVSGTMKSIDGNKNLFGDLYAFEFRNAELRNGFIIMSDNIPDVRYKQFTLSGAQKLWIKLDGMRPDAHYLFSFEGCRVSMKYCLETLSNEELEFEQMSSLIVDMNGNMSGSLYVNREQSLQLLVPGGAALRVEDAFITVTKGNVVNGSISGKLVLPFEQGDITDIGVPGSYARGEHPETNEMDELEKGIITDNIRDILRKSLIHFGETVQQNGLLICPEDFESQDKCAYIPIFLENWLGRGIVMENSHMTTARITERSLDMEKQRAQALILTPTAVSVDLDRESYIPKQTGSQTPSETEKPFWVGLVIKGGKLALPPAFIQQDGGGVIEFALAEGEMIYDLNGFNYQTYLYNDEGVPADFGDELGGFTDVVVYDCLLDLYANKVNLEINAEVKVELFQNNWVKVKLYTNKKDNEDGKAGEFLCSVAPTIVENALANDTDMRIDGGWLKPDGMHINGALILPAVNTAGHEITSDTPLSFSDMLIHPKLNLMQSSYDPQRKYGSVTLNKPVNISFNGYTIEVREFDFEYIRKQKPFIKLSMRGAALLADNIPLSKETRDSIILKYPLPLGKPEVLYDETYVILDANFDDCISVVGKLIPKHRQNDDSLMEFETSVLEYAFLKQIKNMPVEAFTRFGYDKEKGRCYYAIGIIPKSGSKSISFGAGEIKDYTGLVAYNMQIGRDELDRFMFPENASQMNSFISFLPVYKGSNSSFAAGVKGTMVVAKLCEIRNMYFGFESGPKVFAGGELYLPLDVSAIVGGSAYRKVGSVEMKYRHNDRYFSFSMTLDRINLILATVSGSMGFEYSPSLFGVYLGYPETMVGNISIFHVGAGVGFRIDDNGTSMVQAKMELGLEKDITVSIVYLRGYLYAGVDGSYYFEDATINLELYLKGGLEGGIKVKGKRFNIISFYLDARGSVSSSSPYTSWMLRCSCEVSYSLDLWLFSVEGSVSASFDTTLG